MLSGDRLNVPYALDEIEERTRSVHPERTYLLQTSLLSFRQEQMEDGTKEFNATEQNQGDLDFYTLAPS